MAPEVLRIREPRAFQIRYNRYHLCATLQTGCLQISLRANVCIIVVERIDLILEHHH